MPIAYAPERIVLTGECAVVEAADFAERLRAEPRVPVDPAAATHVHTAVIQTLLAFAPVLDAAPTDPFLRDCLAPLLTRE